MKSVSIGDMVRLILRSGDIDNRAGVGDRTEEGQEVHRLLQSAYGTGWEKEVAFKGLFEAHGIQIQGRADGIFERRMVHEIKSTRRALKDWNTNGLETHWAQAYCYAYLLAESEGLGEVEVMLTYYNLKTEERRDFSRTCSSDTLKTYVEDLITRYAFWNQLQIAWIKKRNVALQSMPFPYGDYRHGQRHLAAAVYTALRDNFDMMAEAPTGVGKTISTLFPAMKAMGEDHIDRVFYLTAKTVARTVAEDAAEVMRRAGGYLKLVTLTAREKVCFTDEKKCNPEDCTYARGHYDRINDCLLDTLRNEDHMDREHITQFAKAHHVCPFELAFDLAEFSDVVVCDYNYVFDPLVRIQRFFGEVSERYAFLVDEGHNLPSRARGMFSAQVEKDQIVVLRKAFPKKSEPYRELGKLIKSLADIAKNLQSQDKAYDTDEMLSSVICSKSRRSFDAAVSYIADTDGFELPGEEGEILSNLYRFDSISELFSTGYLWVETTEGGGTGRMMCIDPSELLQHCYQQARATILFSATMAPYAYYEEVLGLSGCRKLVLESPFSKEHQQMLLGVGIDTRLRSRETAYAPIARYIEALASGRPSNYLVFLPSYDFMNRIYDQLEDRAIRNSWILHPQKPGMSEAEKVAYLETFEYANGQTVIGLAVLGGSFSEGIDLVGSRLEGVVIVGFGTPYMNAENNIIQQYYDTLDKDGYTYAFVYPAINKVVQAVGRLIRTETDRGVVLFLDDRYQSQRYKQLLPNTWHMKRLHQPTEVYEEHLQFWDIRGRNRRPPT